MDLNQLKYFRVVAKTGNMSKAAQTLYITQPNLSRSIARLEKEIGVSLFEHRKGKIVLNEYGRAFLSSVDLIFSELNFGVQTVRRLYETSQNFLCLACTIDGFLRDVLKEFFLHKPNIGIKQLSLTPEEVLEHLLDHTLSLAVTSYEIQNEQVVFELLGQEEYVILMHRSHPLANSESVMVSQLADEKFICDASRLNLHNLKKICGKAGFYPNVGYEVQNSELTYKLLEENAGIAFMPFPQYLVIKKIDSDSAVRFARIKDEIPNAIIGVAYHKNYEFNSAAVEFVDFLRNWLKEENGLIHELKDMPRTI